MAMAIQSGRAKRLEQAAQLFQLGRFNEAETICLALLRENGADSGALRQLGRIELARGAFGNALDVLSRIHDIGPEEGWLHLALGSATEMTGDFQAAIGHYTRAIEAGEASAKVYAFLANALRKNGQLIESMNLLTAVMNAEPFSIDLQIALGDVLTLQGYLDEAQEAYEHILESGAEVSHEYLAEVHLKLANLMRRAGRLDQAGEHEYMAREAMAGAQGGGYS